MKIAKAVDWITEALPQKRTTIHLDRTFSPQEMRSIRRGLIPRQMEDKWFIYCEDDMLFFHRSWTGYCIYIVHFAAAGDNYEMFKADVNRDPKQYSETSEESDMEMISYLVDLLMFHQEPIFPGDEPSSEKGAMANWSQVGRAMLGQHPDHA